MMEHLGSQQDRDVTALAHRAASLLGCGVDSIDRVRGGGNNALFQLKTVRGFFALKRYMESVGDDRDRIGHEYDGLAFLAEAGELAVPRPVAVDRQEKIAIFEWLDGSSVTSVHENDIPAALAFLGRLHEYGRLAAAVNRPAAREGESL
jgi:Ser/Thr protein kinase RdoA (MazF antagonist)